MDIQPPDYEVLDFHWDTSHGHIVTMLQRRADRGIVLDLGCGSAPIAEPLRDAGFTYIGLDVNAHCLDALRTRGFAAQRVDLRDLDGMADALDAAVAHAPDGHATPVVAVLALDVIEHLVEPHVAVHAMSSWLQRRNVPVFGLSVPNVTHRDVAVKLLNARWELTPSGLLDATHLRFFTETSLAAVTRSCGLREIDRLDSTTPWSDQHWPIGSPLLHETTPLGRFLADLRARADDHAATYQFVRLFEPAAVPSATPALPMTDAPADVGVRLAVVASPTATSDDIETLRDDLAAQSNEAWELTGPGDVVASGCSHVAVVGPGQRVAPCWVDQFVEAGALWHGMILRCRSLTSGDGPSWADRFDLLEHDVVLATAPAALAFPIAALDALGVELGDASAGAVHRLVRELAPYCGVHDTQRPAAAAVSPWTDGAVDARAEPGPADAAAGPVAPVLVERWMLDELAAHRRRAADDAAAADLIAGLTAHNAELERDNTWLNEELRQAPVRLLRRLLRRPGRRADR